MPISSGDPRVNSSEKDLSARVPSFPGVYGAILIPGAAKGPLEPFFITSEGHLIDIFTPDKKIKIGYDNAYYSAIAFLGKSDKLWVRRVVSNALYGGVKIMKKGSTSPNIAITTGLSDPEEYEFTGDELLLITGANPGIWNNDISVKIIPYRTKDTFTVDIETDIVTITTDQGWITGSSVVLSGSESPIDLPLPLVAGTTYYVIFVTATTIKLATSYANALAGTSINFTDAGTGTHIIAPTIDKVKEPGAFAIEVYKDGELVEDAYICSRNPDSKNGYGQSNYVENITEGSNYIKVIDNTAVVDTTINPKEQIVELDMDEGTDGDTITDSMMITALQDFAGEDSYRLTVLMDGGWATPSYQQAIASLCETRKDCIGVLSTPYDKEASASYITDLIDYRRNILNLNSSYVALYTPHVKIADKYNDRSLYIAPDGYAAAAISDTASNYEMWYPPAGFSRGKIIASDLRRRLTSSERGVLYDEGMNCLRYAPGKGIALWGQKTQQSRPSALDRLNVRLLLLVIQPAVKAALEYFIFDLNTAGTRSVVYTLLKSYMEDIKGRNGVYDFYIVCDGTNNTSEDIDQHRLNVDLYIKPTMSIEYINFQTVIMRTGMSFKVAQEAV